MLQAYSVEELGQVLKQMGEVVEVPTWQALDVREMPQGKTFELDNVTFGCEVDMAVQNIEPNLPWAENHFQERVGGVPLNPPPSHEEWPYAQKSNKEFQQGKKFSHTYPERYWPRHTEHLDRYGKRYRLETLGMGDLNDVVNLLARQPTTRQAYLPVWFPFDTGAVHGERVPCSLGYLFMMRDNKLNIIYYIRSCDFYRHFRDDVYMTARLCQWVLDRLLAMAEESDPVWAEVTCGTLTMHIGSLHIFEAELPRLRREYETK